MDTIVLLSDLKGLVKKACGALNLIYFSLFFVSYW